MTKKELVSEVILRLKEEYPNVKCTLDYTTPIEMLIATQLSAQCTDARVNIVTRTLFKKYTSVYDFANADYDELCEDIRSAGFYRNKAKNIIGAAQRIIDVYGGEVPNTMEDLLTLPGTGRKTANLVLGDIFKKPAIVVDTHCIRLANRMGLVDGITEPKKVEMALWKIIPPEEGSDFCHRLVYHGRDVCTARTKPYCDKCCLNDICKKNI